MLRGADGRVKWTSGRTRVGLAGWLPATSQRRIRQAWRALQAQDKQQDSAVKEVKESTDGLACLGHGWLHACMVCELVVRVVLSVVLAMDDEVHGTRRWIRIPRFPGAEWIPTDSQALRTILHRKAPRTREEQAIHLLRRQKAPWASRRLLCRPTATPRPWARIAVLCAGPADLNAGQECPGWKRLVARRLGVRGDEGRWLPSYMH